MADDGRLETFAVQLGQSQRAKTASERLQESVAVVATYGLGCGWTRWR